MATSHHLPRTLKLFPKLLVSNANHIRTTKYSLLSFLPKALFFKVFQFPIPYFIFYFLLLNIHEVTISEAPFFFLGLIGAILVIHLIKEGLSERVRFTWSKKVNKSSCELYDPQQKDFVAAKAAALQLGSVVKIRV